jgi:hypothetical protein
MTGCVPTYRKAYSRRMSNHPLVSTLGMFRSISLFVFPFFACSFSSYFSVLKNTQLAAKCNRLTQLVKIPILRMPLAMLAVIADMSVVVFDYFLCHNTILLASTIWFVHFLHIPLLVVKTPTSHLLCANLFEGDIASLAVEKHAVTTLVTHFTPRIHFATLLLCSNTIVLSLSLALCYYRV